jgi:signal transduction histidine kinase
VPAQLVDTQLMEQALLNIVKNAIEAIDARRSSDGSAGGFIQVALAHEGQRVKLSIVDSGAQLGAASGHHLFTPFFSTKKGGQGIGLMFVREVLNRHGCSFALAPGPGGETRFDIWFPPVAAAQEALA